VKGVWQGFQTVIPAKAGIHGNKKRWSRMYLAWVSAFAGTALRLDAVRVFTRKLTSAAAATSTAGC
jgi:hypothetical protein